MRVVVCVKQIEYIYYPIAISSPDGDIDSEKMVYMLNPYDEVAVEEAIRIKERFVGSEVILITVGPPRTEDVLRYAFAFGADVMIRINCENLDSWSTSCILAEAMRSLNYDIVLCGKKAIDTNDSQVGTFLAELLALPEVTGIASLDVVPESNRAMVEKYLGKGDREVVECDLPALFTVEKSMNDPRYPKLPDRLRAAKQKVEIMEAVSLSANLNAKSSLDELGRLTPPMPKPKKVFTPDSHLSANERRKLIMLGGIVAEKKGDLLQGAPEDVAKKIVNILIDEKFV